MQRDIKVVVIGDSAVGKTCLLIRFCEDKYPEEYIPTIYDHFTRNVIHSSETVGLTIWDTACAGEYNAMRPLCYPDTNVFLICFSLCQQESLDNVKRRWVEEINQQSGTFVLVGLKSDVKPSKDYHNNNGSLVDQKQAQRVALETKAYTYIACSALTGENVNRVFETVIECATSGRNSKEKKCHIC